MIRSELTSLREDLMKKVTRLEELISLVKTPLGWTVENSVLTALSSSQSSGQALGDEVTESEPHSVHGIQLDISDVRLDLTRPDLPSDLTQPHLYPCLTNYFPA